MTKPPSPSISDEDDGLGELQAEFGASIQAARKKLGMTQGELGEKCGIAQGDISRIERGLENLTLKTMNRLASVLGGDVAKMLLVSRNRVKDE